MRWSWTLNWYFWIFTSCATAGRRLSGRFGCCQISRTGEMWLQSAIHILRQFMQYNVQNNGTILWRRMFRGLPVQRRIRCFLDAGYLCANRFAIMQIWTTSILNGGESIEGVKSSFATFYHVILFIRVEILTNTQLKTMNSVIYCYDIFITSFATRI